MKRSVVHRDDGEAGLTDRGRRGPRLQGKQVGEQA